jgi:hypothetical protein
VTLSGVRPPAVIPCVLALLFAGCVDTSPNRVKLTAGVDKVDLSIKTGALVTDLSGSFSLELAVGDLASSSEVIDAQPTFQLVPENQAGIGLDALPPASTFPLTLSSGATESILFTLTTQNTLTAAEVSQVCGATVRVVGTFHDSVDGDRAVSVQSDPVTISGCP